MAEVGAREQHVVDGGSVESGAHAASNGFRCRVLSRSGLAGLTSRTLLVGEDHDEDDDEDDW